MTIFCRRFAGVASFFACVSLVIAQPAPLHIKVTAPIDGTVVAGVTPIAASVTGADGGAKVSFFIDGRLVFVDSSAPYSYAWNSGSRPGPRTIRVVANTLDGRSAEDTIRTIGVDSTETVEVKLRQISATVIDEQGRFVKDLEAKDFQVREDGAIMKVTNFYKGDAMLHLVLLQDVSRSMLSGNRIQKSKEAAAAFLRSLRPQDDVMTIAFNHGVYVLGEFGSSREASARALSGLSADGGTSLYDTLITSCMRIRSLHGRKVIVLFSDGKDENSASTMQQASDALMREDVTMYAIGLGLRGDEEDQKKLLADWAAHSGGRAFFTSDVKEVQKFYDQIGEELRWQYSLGYPPVPSNRSWHDIRVTVPGHADLQVRARTGILSK